MVSMTTAARPKRITSPQPEPTSDSGRSIYLWPRAKNPLQQRIYDELERLNWRFDSQTALWYTPESDTLQGFGRLEYAADFSWARIQPPNTQPGIRAATPLLSLTFGEDA